MSDELRVWVGCLACYNEGRLTGAWYDAIEGDEITVERVHADGGAQLTGIQSDDAYRWSPADGDVPEEIVNGHEELWVFDHEGFGGLIDGECSPGEAARIASLVEDIDADDRDALGAFLADRGATVDDQEIDRFRESYDGRHDSEEDFAQTLAEDLDMVSDDVRWPYTCVDWERAARDLFMDGYWSAEAAGGGIHVFHYC